MPLNGQLVYEEVYYSIFKTSVALIMQALHDCVFWKLRT